MFDSIWNKQYKFRQYVCEQVRQGYNHEDNIEAMYRIIREEVEREFNEDNKTTRDSFLTELFEKSL